MKCLQSCCSNDQEQDQGPWAEVTSLLRGPGSPVAGGRHNGGESTSHTHTLQEPHPYELLPPKRQINCYWQALGQTPKEDLLTKRPPHFRG